MSQQMDQPIEKLKKDELIDFIRKNREEIESIQPSFEKIKIFIDEHEHTLENLPSELEQAQQHSTEIQALNQKAVETKQEIDEIKEYVDNKQIKITDFSSRLFEGEEAIENQIQIFQENSKKQFDELKAKIEGLLPGATSAGLASSYQDAQKEKKTWHYWIGFVVSLIVLTGAYFYSFVYKSPPTDFSTIIIRATIGFPLIWIAWFCQRSLSQMTGISEEYRHKEKMMRIYDGFSKQIEKSTDAEEGKTKKIDLISVTINAIAKNPAERLDTLTPLDSLKRKKIEKEIMDLRKTIQR